ncbi:hypothetical protein HI914_02117 [Erysiphe necator]|nr:hypothetical protein HI914_02117 [Erysiphe necator]
MYSSSLASICTLHRMMAVYFLTINQSQIILLLKSNTDDVLLNFWSKQIEKQLVRGREASDGTKLLLGH